MRRHKILLLCSILLCATFFSDVHPFTAEIEVKKIDNVPWYHKMNCFFFNCTSRESSRMINALQTHQNSTNKDPKHNPCFKNQSHFMNKTTKFEHRNIFFHGIKISKEFLSFGTEWIGFTWLGNSMLVREIVSEIAHRHTGTETIIKNLDICYESEHSLILPGGTNIPQNAKVGKITSIYQNGEMYYVAYENCDIFKHDIIVQYSITNIKNFEMSELYHPSLLKKMIYIPPLEYEYMPYHDERDMTPFTTFYHAMLSRRQRIVSGLWEHGIIVENYNGITSSKRMREIYDSKAIMINLHQTPHHHTFEELRVLPALLRGLIIICEETPLKSEIPYNQFIVWSSIENLPTTVSKVILNYDFYFNEFFGPKSDLPCILASMKRNAYNLMEQQILQIHRQKTLDSSA
jgi:hypothetical protein